MEDVVVRVLRRRKLGRRLTICSCEMRIDEEVESVDVVASDENSARALRSGEWHLLRIVEIEEERSRTGRRVLRVVEYGEKCSAPSLPVAPLVPKRERAQVFANWIRAKFGSDVGRALDVAGGRGELSHALLSLCSSATVIDPEQRLSPCTGVTFVRRKFEYPAADSDLVEDADAVFALHPDEATEAAVCAAAAAGLPFAVVPCCVFPSLFSNRRQFWQCDPSSRNKTVRTHETFVEYLVERAKALGASDTKTDQLGFQGKNLVVYSLGRGGSEKKNGVPSLDDDCVRAVFSFFDPLEDLVFHPPHLKTVCRKWNFEATRVLRSRIPLFVDAFRMMLSLVAFVDEHHSVSPLAAASSTNANNDGPESSFVQKSKRHTRAATPRDLVRILERDEDDGDESDFPALVCLRESMWRQRFVRLLVALQVATRGPVWLRVDSCTSTSSFSGRASFSIYAVRADLLMSVASC